MELECYVRGKAESWQEIGDSERKKFLLDVRKARNYACWSRLGNDDGDEPLGTDAVIAVSGVCGLQ